MRKSGWSYCEQEIGVITNFIQNYSLLCELFSWRGIQMLYEILYEIYFIPIVLTGKKEIKRVLR